VGWRGPRKGSGLRSTQALALVQGQPGITITELAAKMDIKQNYLYRVMPSCLRNASCIKTGAAGSQEPRSDPYWTIS
jgi:DNA-binding IscR family transcriptional regulator